MKSAPLSRGLLKGFVACFLVLAFCLPASAAITLYDKDATTFSVDGFFNTFYTYSSQDDGTTTKDQSRVKMGFLPNYIGFNFSKQVDNLKLGGRSSFWVTINDSSKFDQSGDAFATNTGIDVRQFYGTVDGDWGQVLFGKDFTLFSRSNIFNDEILTGFGKTSSPDTSGVSFGNIGSGYVYPLPSAQITYRTPRISGFKLAVGIVDPAKTSGAAGEENAPRFEGELTYNQSFDQVSVIAWVGGMTQSSDNSAATDVDSNGVSYGLNAKFAGFSITGSGFNGSGLNTSLGAFPGVTDGLDSNGYLVQGSYTIDKVRLVASYGKTEIDNATNDDDETIIGAVFYNINDYLKLSAEYSVEKANVGVAPEVETDTIALGAVLNF